MDVPLMNLAEDEEDLRDGHRTAFTGSFEAWSYFMSLQTSRMRRLSAVDDTNVYWSGAGQVAKSPKAAEVPATLWSSSTIVPLALAVDSTSVYFMGSIVVQGQPSEILAVPIGVGSAATLESSPNGLVGPLVLGPYEVYWAAGPVQAVPKAGAPAGRWCRA
ncbi:MAG: hypothetical protein ABSC94_32145 [Polyangiaceae bacterium]|jgi:hypothetical protein